VRSADLLQLSFRIERNDGSFRRREDDEVGSSISTWIGEGSLHIS